MAIVIDYYLTCQSPWSYLGHARLVDIAARYNATIVPKPVDYGRIFPLSGGLPLPKRAPQRQAYRLVELARWRDFLGVPLTVQPRFFPVDGTNAALMVVAAGTSSTAGLVLAGAILHACWAEERDIADPAVLGAIARENGLDADSLAAAAALPETRAAYDRLTQEAIDRGVFGAPTYVVEGELFWGQDRLDFVNRRLAQLAKS